MSSKFSITFRLLGYLEVGHNLRLSMGQKSSKESVHAIVPTTDETEVIVYPSSPDVEFPMEIQVAHYTPSSFPLTPVVTKHTIALCKESWNLILHPIVDEESGSSITGLTAFYTEFYDTLELLDASRRFETVLLQHTGGVEAKVAKGAILIRIVNYALNIEPESEKARYGLYCLGKSHNQKLIRPWQYAVFIQCLLTTLSSRLDKNATHEVMSAWVNLFAFMLRNILPVAIKGLVDNVEVNVNISAVVGNTSTTDELFEADQARELKKVEKKNRSRGSSENSSRARSTPSSKKGVLDASIFY